MLGVRGLPGNSINHINSFFVPNHGPRVFVAGEVDMVSGVGFKPERWLEGSRRDLMDIRHVVTDLCVMDFGGPDRAVRVRSLHPGVSFAEVQEKTGFPLLAAEDMGETAHPTAEQLAIIRRLDPHDLRASALKGNPPGIRAATVAQA
ncbi:3-oxoadipate CoA-transferase subunit B [compost metagenome]